MDSLFNPSYAVLAYCLCALLVILGIVLFVLRSHGAGVIVILLSLTYLGIILSRNNIRRFIHPTIQEQAADINLKK